MKYSKNNLAELKTFVDFYKFNCEKIDKQEEKFRSLNRYLYTYSNTLDDKLRQQAEYSILKIILKQAKTLKVVYRNHLKYKINKFIDDRKKYLSKLKYKNVSKYKYKPKRPKMY